MVFLLLLMDNVITLDLDSSVQVVKKVLLQTVIKHVVTETFHVFVKMVLQSAVHALHTVNINVNYVMKDLKSQQMIHGLDLMYDHHIVTRFNNVSVTMVHQKHHVLVVLVTFVVKVVMEDLDVTETSNVKKFQHPNVNVRMEMVVLVLVEKLNTEIPVNPVMMDSN